MRARAMMRTVARTLLSIVGGYVASSAIIAALAVLAVATGMERSEAATSAAMLGFLVYLAVIIWSFSDPRLLRVALALVAVTAIGTAVVWLDGRVTG